MTTIELEFLASRYHGTAWGRHVNEGAPEWPPSPYRLIRALYDVWKRKCAHIPESQIQELFAALANDLPDFYLPQAISAHTRSYLSANSFDASDKNLVFDAFVSVAQNSRCWMEWRTDLTPGQRSVLQQLLAGLNYLGRSESWIAASLGERDGDRICRTCRPVPPESKDEITYVACPVGANEYQGKEKWLDALAYSSSQVIKEKLSGPPAMRSVRYSIGRGAVATWLPPWKSLGLRVSAAVLELHAPVLPRITDAIWIAERFRGRLMRYFENQKLPIPSLVHGKDKDGSPLRDHSQLFVLPQANKLGRIDSLYVFTRNAEGFRSDVRDAIVAVRGLAWMDEIRVTPVWVGSAVDHTFRPGKRVVTSVTPFVTVRHWRKGRGTMDEFLKKEVARECGNHGLACPSSIEPMEFVGGINPVRFRKHRDGDPSRKGYGFLLEFEEPVVTPFSLGYACHFGLGQFA